MPLLVIDVVRGRSPEQLALPLDTVHATVVASSGVPQRDRYQVLRVHEPSHLVVQDTGHGRAQFLTGELWSGHLAG